MEYKITGQTKLTGLLGSPVAHSISPLMHNEAFKQLGLDYAYLAFDVRTGELSKAVEGLKALGARGWNLTMPDKNLMCELVDELSPAAKICGAVNTVVNQDGYLTGYTTDGIGFMRAIQEEGLDVIGKKMTIMGAGGAASAIMVQAALDGVAEITVFNRKSEFFVRAEKIMEELRKITNCKLCIYDYSDEGRLKSEILESAVLVNATSVGMAPNIENTLINDSAMFHKELFVYDTIYNPRETKLMKDAKASGCKVANGLNMLLYQGAEAFRLWTGEEMPVKIIKEKYFTV